MPQVLTGINLPESSDVRQSWYRSRLAGLTPASAIRGDLVAVNTESRLVKAAAPVLDSLAHQLRGSNYGALLADRQGTIVGRVFGSQMLADSSDELGVVIGARFTEQTTGTNAISTAIETRREVFILGEQHFLECLRTQVCFGLPIFQPGTGRLEGAMALIAPSDESPKLMRPVLTSAVQQIQQRLLSTYSDSQLALMLAFRATCDRCQRMPVVAVERTAIYTNDLAAIELQSSDYALLRELATRDDLTFSGQFSVNLSIGEQVTVAFERVSDHGTVFRIQRHGEGTRAVPRLTVRHRTMGDELTEALTRAQVGTGHVLIHGEAGSGRTSTARHLCGVQDVPLVDGRDAVNMGSAAWASRLRRTTEASRYAVIVESVDLLDARLLGVLQDAMERTPARIILTSNNDAELIAPLAAACRFVIELPNLRLRRSEFSAILMQMLSDRETHQLRFTAAAVAALAAHDWPGNLKELQIAVDEVRARRSVGDVTVADLPLRYQAPARQRNLTLLEQAEFDTIRKVLTQVRGNKAQAAQLLGISRTTLYARIRALGLRAVSY
jgi:transcriptional regulator of acetoin/glycerol metabolism